MSIEIQKDDMLGGGNAVKFPEVGASVTGKILRAKSQPQTDFQTGEIVRWPNGDEKLEYVFWLDTDDGEQTLYARNQLWIAVRDAIKASSPSQLPEVGGTLAVKYTGDGTPKQAGFNPPKLYAAKYTPAPAIDIDADAF